MREIKFRQPIFNIKGVFIKYHYWGFINGEYVVKAGYISSCMQKYTTIHEQYTWLKDKNWVEIYEGDYITWWVDWEVEPYLIEWKEINNWSGMADGNNNKSVWFHLEEYYFTFNKCEVIGNIYKTPELLISKQ